MDKSGSIAVFDSGMGGLTVLKSLIKILPYEDYIYYADTVNVPYGCLSKKAITDNTIAAVENILEMNVKAIVVACNTATSVCIETLRKNYDIPILGIEPAIKMAIEDCGEQSVYVFSTVRTKKEISKKYLKNENIIFMGLKNLASEIEQNIFDTQFIESRIEKTFNGINRDEVKYIVLGCTHFILIKEQFEKFFVNAKFFDGNEGISRRLNYILSSRELKKDSTIEGNVEIFNSSNSFGINERYRKLLEP